jgi:hypothetical protein
MTVQNRSSLLKEGNGAADFLAVVNQFLPPNDQAHLSQTCHLAQTIFKNNLGILLSSSLPSATLLTEFRQRRAAASPAKAILHLTQLEGHKAAVISLVMRSDGTRLYSGSFDHTIKVWDMTTGTCLQTLAEHTSSITSLHLSHDEKILLSGSCDNTIKIWDLKTGKCLKTLQNTSSPLSLQTSLDGQTLFCGFGYGNHTVQVWDIITGICLHTLCGHNGSVPLLQMSSNGKTLFSGSDDSTIKVWDVTTRGCLNTLHGHTSHIFSLQISPDGKTLFSGSKNGTIKVWDLVTGNCLHTVQAYAGSVFSLQISPDGKTLFSAGVSISVWNLSRLPEEMITFISKETNIARNIFDPSPRSMRHPLSTLASFIKRQKSESSDDLPSNCKELPYYLNPHNCNTLLGQEQLACDLYNAKFFLSGVAEAFTELSDKQEDLDTLQASLLLAESFQRLDRFSDSLKNKVYEMLYVIHSETKQLPTNTPSDYGRLAFYEMEGCTATHRERAEAVLRVYPALHSEI